MGCGMKCARPLLPVILLCLLAPASALEAEPLFDTFYWIGGVTPATASPRGGQVLTITGAFQTPVRALFDLGGGRVREAFVISAAFREIILVTPPVELVPPAQSAHAILYIVNGASTATERRVQTDYRFVEEHLTPVILTASPQRGPFMGRTLVTIFGEGFQSPLQVFFGSAEAQVLKVSFDQVMVVSPPGPPGLVPVRIVNVGSDTETTQADGFRYRFPLAVSQISPESGPASGTTEVTLAGAGFEEPVNVVCGGIHWQVLRVTESQVVALAGPRPRSPRGETSCEVRVVNIADQDEALGPLFRYVAQRPELIGFR
jgi:hypothetical protein